MSKTLRTAAVIVGAVALIATGVGAIAAPGLAGTVTVAGVSTTALFAASGALSIAAALTAPKPSAGSSSGSTEQFAADPDGSIPYLMGRFGTSGNIVFRRAWDTTAKGDNDRQSFVTVLSGGGPIAGVEGQTVDQKAVTYDSGGQAIGTFAGFMWHTSQLGAIPTASALTFGTGAGTPPGWGSDRRLHGLAATGWTLRFDTKGKHFQSGVPQPKWVALGVLCYDPRKDSTYPGGSGSHRWADPSDIAAHTAARATWEYTTNPYLHGLRWALGTWERDVAGSAAFVKTFGMGLPLAGVDFAAFVEGANVAQLNGWACNGVVFSGDGKWESLKKILQAGMGEPVLLGAKLSCFVNAPKVSLATITAADIAGATSLTMSQSRSARINRIVPRYYQEAKNWQLLPGTPVAVPEYFTIDRGQRSKTVDYQLITSEAQIAVACRYDIENAREFGPLKLPLKLRWIGYRPGDCVTLALPEDGISNQKILLLNRDFDVESLTPTFTARSETDGKHAYALGQTSTPPPTPGTSADALVPVPGSGAWAITGTAITDGVVVMPALVITGAVDSPVVETIVVEYRKFVSGQAASVNWTSWGSAPPATTRFIITGTESAATYEVGISYQRRGVTGARTIIGPSSVNGLVVPFDNVGGPNKPEDGATNTANPDSMIGGLTVAQLLASVHNAEQDIEQIKTDIEGITAPDLSGFQAELDEAREDLDALVTTVSSVSSTASGAVAAVTAEAGTRASADSALGGRIDAVQVSLGANAAAITSEQLARVNADSALTGSINAMQASVDNANGRITTEIAARASADSALTNSVSSLTSRVGAAESSITNHGTTLTNHTQSIATLTTTVAASQAIVSNLVFNTRMTSGTGWLLATFWSIIPQYEQAKLETALTNYTGGLQCRNFPVSSGQVLSFSFEAWRPGLAAGRLCADVAWLDASGNVLGYSGRIFLTGRSGVTTRYSFDNIVAPNGSTQATMRAYLEVANVDGGIAVQRFQVERGTVSHPWTDYSDVSGLTAQVSTNTAAIADIANNKLAAFWQVTATAGSSSATISAIAQSGGTTYSAVGIVASQFTFKTSAGALYPLLSGIGTDVVIAGNLVVTGSLRANSVTKRAAVTLGSAAIGNGAQNNVLSMNVQLDYAADVIIQATGSQNYFGGVPDWQADIYVDGSPTSGTASGGAGAYVSSWALSSKVSLSAGTHNISIMWRGGNSQIRLTAAGLITDASFR